MNDLYTITEDKKLSFNLHPGQTQAWETEARIILVLAGTQSGKTSFGPLWLLREIQSCGPGDYIVAAPTYPLLSLKPLPEFKKLFEKHLKLGRYTGGPPRQFKFSIEGMMWLFGISREDAEKAPDTVVFFGHAQDPDSLESATAKAAWLDEAGQKKFKQGSYDAVLRRLALHRGRVLLTTTPYYFGWLKTDLHDKALTGKRHDVELISFESRMNPQFSEEEWLERKSTMPKWKFDLFYRARFTRPPGLIYDCFDEDKMSVERFDIPANWTRFWGADFGGVNTAFVKLAQDPESKVFYIYDTYLQGSRTAKQHVQALLASEGLPLRTRGGAKSEDQWRKEFSQAGLPILEPLVSEVEVGIDRVYALISEDRLRVFDDLDPILNELNTYTRALDDNGEVTEEIEDKNKFHHLDALRYIATDLKQVKRARIAYATISGRA